MRRHNFARHLLAQKTDIRDLPDVRGHGSTKTTESYTPVTNKAVKGIVTPKDEIMRKK
ncbi:MAG: hypothetical protein EOL88_12365 [Bacteroidia bacterium]|nr:hypothetical protein [Bacteroidia bacterium]